MLFGEVIKSIGQAEVGWACKDVKNVIFWDDLRGAELLEMVSEGTFHNFSLVKDAMQRLGYSIGDLKTQAFKLILQYPDSYLRPEDREWAIWDIVDNWVIEVISRDKRIQKRLDDYR